MSSPMYPKQPGDLFHCSGHFLESVLVVILLMVQKSGLPVEMENIPICIYTWNPTDLYFWRDPTLQNKAFSNQNKGHLGSRYIYNLQGLKKNWCLAGFLSSTIGLLQFDRPYNSHEEPNGRLHWCLKNVMTVRKWSPIASMYRIFTYPCGWFLKNVLFMIYLW